MIFSLVSMTSGNSFFIWLALLCTVAGLEVLSMPVAPSAKPVTTAPISPILRSTPPSAVTFNTSLEGSRQLWLLQHLHNCWNWAHGPLNKIIIDYTYLVHADLCNIQINFLARDNIIFTSFLSFVKKNWSKLNSFEAVKHWFGMEHIYILYTTERSHYCNIFNDVMLQPYSGKL